MVIKRELLKHYIAIRNEYKEDIHISKWHQKLILRINLIALFYCRSQYRLFVAYCCECVRIFV